MQQRLRNRIHSLACLLLSAASLSAHAVDFSLSGYGTIGYAQSDQDNTYQRFIDNKGSFKRDTVLGAQLSARFNPEWSATVQAKLAPAADSDQDVKATLSWAFVSFRPTDDWLFRAGKLRIPFYLNSENTDVGTTFTPARLPIEVYSTAATVDFVGASFAKTWQLKDNELVLDGYWGKANDASWRFYARDPYNPLNPLLPQLTPDGQSGEFFAKLNTESKGLRLSLNQGGNTFLVGIHRAETTPRDSTNLGPSTYVPVSDPFFSAGTVYLPAANTYKITTTTAHLGASIDLGHGFRTIGEYVRRKNAGSTLSPDSKGFYLTLEKEVGHWTPYLTYAKLTTKNRDLYQAVSSAQPLHPIWNPVERALADVIVVYDQQSWALGTSYTIDSKNKIKAEWSVVETGLASSFVDAPPGGESSDQHINVFSLSYNFTF
ncbi:MAG: hypothetical protein GZ085_09130 [Sulfuriferula multivorans]|uniref:Porin n=1 Tax=Sulfuriferula multivorans TaxID=1559896 RepID=A0A7C9K3D3_9PROT|nr:hypothetical protein [Sulfuriferula multivorans]